MSRPDPETVRALHARLRAHTVHLGGYRPAEALAALPGGLPEDDLVVAAALSALRDDSTVIRDAAGPIWTMRPSVRYKVLNPTPDTPHI